MISNFSMSQALKHAALIVGALIVILPFYAMLSYSLKSPHEIETNTGGFFGAQEPMVDEWCVKANNPSGVLPSEELKQSCTTIPVVFNYAHSVKRHWCATYLTGCLLLPQFS
jgi:multiple sugar transport system permease protein